MKFWFFSNLSAWCFFFELPIVKFAYFCSFGVPDESTYWVTTVLLSIASSIRWISRRINLLNFFQIWTFDSEKDCFYFLSFVCYVLFFWPFAIPLLRYNWQIINCTNLKYTVWEFFFFNFIATLFIYLFYFIFLAVLGLRFVRGLSPVAASGGHSSLWCGDRSSSRCTGLSLSRPLPLQGTGSRRASSVAVAHGPSCSVACGIFPDQGSNPCPLH